MNVKKLDLKNVYLMICLSLSTGNGFAQDCPPLTIDSISNPGVYEVATLTEDDGIRNGPDYQGATIYYPTDATPPYACIAIVPGFVMPESSIQDWGPFFASHGIVTMTIGTNNPLDNPPERRDALLDAIVTIKAENLRTESSLFGSIDTTSIAVGGWSMGGGGAQLAAAADTTIKAVMALCPWLNKQTTAADIDHPVPVLIFSAELDVIAPHNQHADIHYDNTPATTNKLIFEINNAGHTVANSPTGGDDYVGKIALSWMNYYLLGDSCYCPLLLDAPPTASRFTTNVVCQNSPTSIFENAIAEASPYLLYPSPCRDSINLRVEHLNAETTFEIFSQSGTLMSKGFVSNPITNIDVQHFAAGVYYMQVITPAGSDRLKFIVL